MSQPYDLNTKRRQVRYLIETVPGLLDHPILPLLLYWKVFDGCDIPKATFDSILAKGTPPDSLTRLVRFALADIEADRLRAGPRGEDCHEPSSSDTAQAIGPEDLLGQVCTEGDGPQQASAG